MSENLSYPSSTLVVSSPISDHTKPTVLIISESNQTEEFIKTSLIHLKINLVFVENRNHALAHIEINPGVSLILFDVTNFTEEKLNKIHNHVSDEYFSLGKIPAILIISQEQTVSILDLFSNNVIDFLVLPLSPLDFIARIKLHLSVLIANQEIKNLADHLQIILEGTRNIAKTRDPLTATTVACSFILQLAKDEDASLETIYMPVSYIHSDDNFVSHKPLEGFSLLTEPDDVNISEYNGLHLADILSPLHIQGSLFLPVVNEKEILALLQFRGFPETIQRSKNFNSILSIVDSLSIVLRNFRHEDQSRLANIGQMAATIIHDLKNYTVVIRNSAKLAMDDSLSAQQKFQFLNNISYESERMVEMTHDILDFSRGGLSISRINLNVDQFIEKLRQFLYPLCKERNVKLQVNGNFKGEITIDPERLLRAVFNIATNACDAMENNPPEKRLFTLDLIKKGAIFEIDLKDTGKGIPPEIRNKIFEPFVSSRKKTGTGLGMAIAKSIIESHEGTISFTTEKNKGTTFVIQIPQKLV